MYPMDEAMAELLLVVEELEYDAHSLGEVLNRRNGCGGGLHPPLTERGVGPDGLALRMLAQWRAEYQRSDS